MKKNLLRTHKKLISLFALALVVLGGGYFGHAALGWYSISTDNSVTVNIITGTSAQDKQSLTVAKGSCTSFTLSTKTKTSDQYGYTLSAYTSGTSGSTMPSGISIKKSDNTTIVSTSSTSPTEVIKTTSANTTLDNTSTTYYACADSNIADGSYDVNFGYVLAENPTVYAAVYNGANFQDTTTDKSESCSSLKIGDVVTMTDTRNGQQYRARKMEDGNCWMIDNLKLELTNNTVLTPQDSDVAADIQVALATGGLKGNFTVSGDNTVNNTDAYGTNYANYDAWRQNDPSVNDRSNYCSGGSARTATNWPSETLTGCGYFYNFYTATAGSANSSTKTASKFNAPDSICPRNWHLPTTYNNSGNPGEFAVLNASMHAGAPASTGSFSNYYAGWQPTGAWQGVFSGAYFGLSSQPFPLDDQSEWGYYQSSTAQNQYGNYDTSIANDTSDQNEARTSVIGEAIRCVTS